VNQGDDARSGHLDVVSHPDVAEDDGETHDGADDGLASQVAADHRAYKGGVARGGDLAQALAKPLLQQSEDLLLPLVQLRLGVDRESH